MKSVRLFDSTNQFFGFNIEDEKVDDIVRAVCGGAFVKLEDAETKAKFYALPGYIRCVLVGDPLQRSTEVFVVPLREDSRPN